MITFPEMMFYAEAEGLLPTRVGRLNAVINDLKKYPGTIDFYTLNQILRKHGFRIEDLDERDRRYIDTYVN